MKAIWNALKTNPTITQTALSMMLIALAIMALGAASIEQLSVDYSTRACAQNVNFTGTFQVGGIAPTNANTASAIVKRDSSGNFSAGTITASLTGNASGSSGSCTGNAATATLSSTVTAAATTDTECFPALFTDATGSLGAKTDTGISYNATTHALTTTTFIGALTGAASANPTISSGTAAPSSTPTKVGDIYIDTSAHKLYFADTTSDSSGWVIAN